MSAACYISASAHSRRRRARQRPADLLKGRDSAEILSWIEGRPAALPFCLACQWLDINPQATRERLGRVAANPDAYRGLLRLVGHRTKGRYLCTVHR
jgi:hypothetical protein